MATTILSRSAVLKTFRQIKENATEEDQKGIWDYVSMRASAHAKANMARCLAAGGDRARSSVAQAIKEWQGSKFLAGTSNGRGQKQQQKTQQLDQQQQRQQQQGNQQQKQRQAAQSRPSASSLGKGRGGQTSGDQRTSDNGNAAREGGARPRVPASSSAARAKGAGKSRAPWADLIVDDETPLLLPDGQRARKCTIAQDDPDENIERACGYVMASSQSALRIACRVARRRSRANPIIIVHQPTSEYERSILSDALHDYQEQVNAQMNDDDGGMGPRSITMQETTLLLRDPNGGDTDSRKVVLIHFNDNFSVTTVDQEGADDLDLNIAPELHCPEDAEEEIALTVVRKMCDQLDLKDWAD